MKRCPKCNRTYSDDTQTFCLEDGTILVREATSSYDPSKTLVLSTPPQQYAPQWAQPPVRSGMNPKVMIAAFAGLLLIAVIVTYLLARSGSSNNISTPANTTSRSARTANTSTGNMNVSNGNTNMSTTESTFKVGDHVRIVSRAGTFKRDDTGYVDVDADAGHYGTIIPGGSDEVPMVRWNEGQVWSVYPSKDNVTLISFRSTINKSYLEHSK